MLTIEALDVRHPSYDVEFWADLNALYRGGKAFRDRIHRFLPKNPVETAEIYEQRKQESSYRSYLGPIVDHYAAWLFSGDFKVRAKTAADGETVDVGAEYAEFREDVGGDVDMKSFLKERFTKAIIEQRSHWLCEIPAAKDLAEWPGTKAEYDAAELNKASLSCVDATDLYDWECDSDGRLLFAVVHSLRKVRKSPKDIKRTNIESWCIYDTEFCTVYQIEYKDNERPANEAVVEGHAYKHGFLQVPLITLCIPEGLWIANRVYDPQKAHFRLGSALDWSIKRTCYAMPVFNLEDETKPPVMGAGYYIMLGKDETMTWAAPPDGQFTTISKEVDAQRNDIYRMTHELAMGLDNNAETVGRSADSKQLDTNATRIMLNAYGQIVAEAIEETYELVSDAFGDTDTYWSIEGLSGYDTATAPEVIGNAMSAQLLQIPSKSYLIEIKTKAALATVPEASQDIKDKIRAEIAAGVMAEHELTNLSSADHAQANKQSADQIAAQRAAAAVASRKPSPGKSASGSKSKSSGGGN